MKSRWIEGAHTVRQGSVRRPWGLRPPFSKADVGRWGEWLALVHLRRLKWDILHCNWRGKLGELDLVAFDGPELVAVEVRTRVSPGDFGPEDSLTEKKEDRLEGAIREYAWRHDMTGRLIRIDFIAIRTPDLRRYELRHYTL